MFYSFTNCRYCTHLRTLVNLGLVGRERMWRVRRDRQTLAYPIEAESEASSSPSSLLPLLLRLEPLPSPLATFPSSLSLPSPSPRPFSPLSVLSQFPMVYRILPLPPGEPIHLAGPSHSDSFRKGTIVEAWDYCRWEWDDTCVPARELAEYVHLLCPADRARADRTSPAGGRNSATRRWTRSSDPSLRPNWRTRTFFSCC